MSDPLPPLPKQMTAVLQHDGVLWTYRPPTTQLAAFVVWGLGSVIAVTILVAALFFAPAFGERTLRPDVAVYARWGLVIALVTGPIAALVGIQRPWQTRVHVGERHLTVERHRVFRRERVVLPIADIEVAKISPPRLEGGTGTAVFRAGDEIVAVGEGKPADQLEWIVLAVDQARRHLDNRDGVEGHEYSFLQHAPSEVEALRRG